MSEWLSLLYVGPRQLVPVAVALVLWVGLAGLGILVTPRGRSVEANPFYGWAIVSSVFTLVGVVVPQPFLALSILAAASALAGIALARRRRQALFPAGAWRVAVLALPLLLIVGAMEPSQWDEFSHWLPASKYLTLYDGFPTAARPDAGPQMFPAYPYGWPILIYLAARIGGGFIDNVGGVLNVVMLLSLALFAVRIGFAVAGKPRDGAIGWPLAAGIVLTATLVNPTFVQKIVLTSYSDIACSAAVGVAVLVGYRLLARLDAGAGGWTASAGWELALMLSLVANIRQPNAVVVATIIGALGLIAWRDPTLSLARFSRAAPLMILPMIAVYGAWRWYVTVELGGVPGAEARLMPFALWNIEAIPAILMAMGGVAVKKAAFFAPMMIACALAVRALVRVRSDFDRIAILTASVFLGYNAFLLFIYVASYELPGALTVTSYWRFNIDIGSVAIVFIPAATLVLWSRYRTFDTYQGWTAAAAIALVTLLPPALAEKIRFDLEAPKPHFTRVAKDLAALKLPGAPYVLDSNGTGESAIITRVLMGSSGKPWMSGSQSAKPDVVASFLKAIEPEGYLLIHSFTAGVPQALQHDLDARRSYLFKRGQGGWTFVRDWPKPADHPW